MSGRSTVADLLSVQTKLLPDQPQLTHQTAYFKALDDPTLFPKYPGNSAAAFRTLAFGKQPIDMFSTCLSNSNLKRILHTGAHHADPLGFSELLDISRAADTTTVTRSPHTTEWHLELVINSLVVDMHHASTQF